MKGGSKKHSRQDKVHAKALWQQEVGSLRDGREGNREGTV